MSSLSDERRHPVNPVIVTCVVMSLEADALIAHILELVKTVLESIESLIPKHGCPRASETVEFDRLTGCT